MDIPNKHSPFELLLKIDWLYNRSNISMPEITSSSSNLWTGIGFRLGSYHFLIDIKNIEEILPDLPFTKIPVVKPWIKGIANMRGHLLPIVDIGAFLDITSSTTTKLRRIMAIKSSEKSYTGFIVDSIFGMQQLSTNNISKQLPPIPISLSPFISGTYKDEAQQINWLLLDTDSLMTNQKFLNIEF